MSSGILQKRRVKSNVTIVRSQIIQGKLYIYIFCDVSSRRLQSAYSIYFSWFTQTDILDVALKQLALLFSVSNFPGSVLGHKYQDFRRGYQCPQGVLGARFLLHAFQFFIHNRSSTWRYKVNTKTTSNLENFLNLIQKGKRTRKGRIIRNEIFLSPCIHTLR